MSNPIPSLLGLTSIADGSQQQAAPIRNNFSAIQTAANALITALKGGTTGALLYATDANDVAYLPDVPADKNGLVWSAALSRYVPAFPPGYEFDYKEFTAPVTVSATTEATAVTVVTADPVTFDGSTPAWIEFSCPYVDVPATGTVFLVLYQDGVSLGLLGVFQAPSSSVNDNDFGGATVKRRMTPATGARTYSIRAFRASVNGTVQAGLGGTGANMPGYIRITKA